VYINDAMDSMMKNKRQGLNGRGNPNRRILKRSTCRDVPPPASGGESYSCTQQKQWGKCDSWFMKNGKFCDKTCERCVEIFEDLTDDYDDYLTTEADVSAETPSEAPALSDNLTTEAPAEAPSEAPALGPTPGPDDADDYDAPGENEDEYDASEPTLATEEDADVDDAMFADVDFDGIADDVLAGEAGEGTGR
jgi:hypothetical protein